MALSNSESESRTTVVGRKRRNISANSDYSHFDSIANAVDSDTDNESVAGHGNQNLHKRSRKTSQVQGNSRSSSLESGEVSSSESVSGGSGDLLSDLSKNLNQTTPSSHVPSYTPLARPQHRSSVLRHEPALNYDDPNSDEGDSKSQEEGELRSDTDTDSDSESASMSISSSESEKSGDGAIHDGLTRLSNVSHDEGLRQFRYFRLTKHNALIYCLCCGVRGHSFEACPARTCPNCGSVDVHAPSACPTIRKCSRCRQKGHDVRECTNRGIQSDPVCDVCRMSGHVEEECSRLWCVDEKPDYETITKIMDSSMRRVCYRCGDSGPNAHWGDDCPRRHRNTVTSSAINLNAVWSAKHADHFIQGKHAEGNNNLNGKEDNDQVAPTADHERRNWQAALFDTGMD